MSYRQLQNMDQNEYKNQLLDDCFEISDIIEEGRFEQNKSLISGIFDLTSGHTTIHAGGDTATQMARLMKEENISGASHFPSEKLGMYHCAQTIAFNADAVKNWFFSTPNDKFPKDSNYDKLVLKTYLDEPTGDGIVRKGLEKRKSKGIVVVLGRNKDDVAKHGFYVKTAFPSLEPEHSELVGRINPKAIENNKIEVEDDKGRVALFANRVPGLFSHTNDSSIAISCRANRDDNLFMYLNDDSTVRFRCYSDRGKEKLTAKELQQRYPEVASAFRRINEKAREMSYTHKLPRYEQAFDAPSISLGARKVSSSTTEKSGPSNFRPQQQIKPQTQTHGPNGRG